MEGVSGVPRNPPKTTPDLLSYCSVLTLFSTCNWHWCTYTQINLKNSFHLIPVHPDEWNLLRICWHHKFYIDTCLLFGLRSAPFLDLFNQLSIAIHWILQHNYKYSVCHLFHYLDDFSTARAPGTPECQETLMRCYHYVRRSMLLLNFPR